MVINSSSPQALGRSMDIKNSPQLSSKKHIYIADDAPTIRALLETSLEGENWIISVFENGKDLLQAISKNRPDIVISDVKMPGLPGDEVCRFIKENFKETFIPVLLLTSLDSTADKVSGLRHGADDYITKPFELEELKARIEVMLRIKALTDELRRTRDLLQEKEKQVLAMTIAGGTAHELGQPLTSVLLNLRLLPSLESASPEYDEVINAIEEQCMRMKKTISDLFNLEKYSAKDYLENLQILDLSEDS